MKEILQLTPDQEALIKTYATIEIDAEGNETYTLNLELKRDKESKPFEYELVKVNYFLSVEVFEMADNKPYDIRIIEE